MNSEETIKSLIKSHQKLIELEASKNAKFIPLTFVQVEAYKLARKAAENFDTKKNIKFSTYLTNALQKLSRLSTQYGASVRVPENKQFKINKLNQLEAELHETSGMTPTAADLADASGMSLNHVNSLLTARKKEVNLSNLSFAPIFDTGDSENEWVHFVYHDLSDKDKLIFEYRTGFGGKPVLDLASIAKKLGMSASTVSQRVKTITDRLAQGMN